MQKKSKIIIVAAAGVLLAAIIVIIAVLMASGSDGKEYQRHMELSQQNETAQDSTVPVKEGWAREFVKSTLYNPDGTPVE